MKSKGKDKAVRLVAPASPQAAELVVGVDGGGTKTRAIVVGEGDEVLGEGLAGPSNPLRVGVASAVTAIRDAVDRACSAARVRRAEIVATEVGLAGVKREDLREAMREALGELGIGHVEVVTDAEIALFGVTEGQPGLVIIAGTGSICYGQNERGKRAWAGGWGPIVGDEGSGSWIARRGLQAVARATDGRAARTPLAKASCQYFNLSSPEDLATAIYAPSMTNDRIAGFARYVIESARARDAAARQIVVEAGRELGMAAAAVIEKLQLARESFDVGYVGGVFAAGELLLDALRREVHTHAPKARLTMPTLAPAEAAARMARGQLAGELAGQLRQLALAG